MGLANPLQVAALVGVIAWPLAAGVGVVLWSRSRAAAQARKRAAVDADLKGLYTHLERRPLPPRLSVVIDALEEGEALKPRSRTRRGAVKSNTP